MRGKDGVETEPADFVTTYVRPWVLPIALGLLCVVAAIVLVDARGKVGEQIALETQARDKAVAMERVRTAMLDSETGQRGYLLTGDPGYLEPFVRGTASLDVVVSEAFGMPALQSREAAEVEANTRALIADKVEEMRETIRLFDAGERDAALALVRTDRGHADMQKIRSVLDVVIAQAADRRDAAQAEKLRWRKRVTNTFFTILGLMTVMLAWAIGNASRARRTALAERSLALSEDARDRIELLAGELDHRMKNIFAVMSGMIRQTASRRSDDVRDYAASLDGRLKSLGKAYYMTRELGEPRDMTSAQILDDVVKAQLLEGNRLEVGGEALVLDESVVTPMALILHELTTNSLKYGAWKPRVRDGVREAAGVNDNASAEPGVETQVVPGVRVNWSRADGDVVMAWEERAPAPLPDHADPVMHGAAPGATQEATQVATQGYGSKLIAGCVRQIGGTVEREWTETGLRLTLRVPAERLLAA